MGEKKSIASNYVYHLAYEILAVIVPLITTPYVSRVLGAGGLGVYSYTYAIATYFCIFGKMGMDTYGQLTVAEHRDDPREMSNRFWCVFLVKACLSLAAGICYVGLIFWSDKHRVMYAVLSIYLFAQVLDISWFFQGIEEFKKIALRNAVIKIIGVILIFLFVKTAQDLLMYAALMQGALLVGNLSLWFRLNRQLQKPDWKEMKLSRHFIDSLPYFVPTIATSVYTILDKSMLGWLTGSDLENGYYEQAHKIEQILATVVTSVSLVTLPRLKYIFAQGKREAFGKIIQFSTDFVLCIACPMMLGVCAIAPNLIPWFLGDGYEKCIPLLQVFSILLPVIGLNNIVGKQVLMAANRQKQYNIGVIVGACVNVLLNLCLIPLLMSEGAALASVASEFVILLVFLWFGRDSFPFGSFAISSVKYFLYSVFMGICIYVLGLYTKISTVGLLLQAGLGVVLYLVILVVSKDRMIQNLKQMLSDRRRHSDAG